MCHFFFTGLLWKGLKRTLEHAWFIAKQIHGFRIPDHWRIWRKKKLFILVCVMVWVYFWSTIFKTSSSFMFFCVMCITIMWNDGNEIVTCLKSLIPRINLSSNMYKRCCSSRWSTDHLAAVKTSLCNTVLWSLSPIPLGYTYLGISVVKAARNGLIINRVKQLRRKPDSGLFLA